MGPLSRPGGLPVPLKRIPLAPWTSFRTHIFNKHILLNHLRQKSQPGASKILDCFLDETMVEEVLSHPFLRLNLFAVRCKPAVAFENSIALSSGLVASAIGNLLSRKCLSLFYEQTLFYNQTPVPLVETNGFQSRAVPLTAGNLKSAILASGSIPLVMSGVCDIPGAPPGVYRDGGIVDYHLDLPFAVDDGIVLFPHYTDRLIPGWFDKKLSWRKPNPQHTDRTILICPSADFVSRLPFAKIPDRTDFVKMDQDQRMRSWRHTVNACRELADDLADVMDNGRLAARLQPL